MFTPPLEALELPLARSTVDRDYLRRSEPHLISGLLASGEARILVMNHDRALLKALDSEPRPELKLLGASEVPQADLYVYLGRTTEAEGAEPEGTPILLALVNDEQATKLASVDTVWAALRATGAGLNDRDAGLFTQALALANWHRSHGFCPRCGTPTLIEEAGWVRRCPNDEFQVFPRTDPAVIVAILDDQERLLLGSQGAWEDNRWSILAGFVEAGESLNAAIQREMFEEAGVSVHDFVFVGSQAWPFPNSLMLGFFARTSRTEIKADGVEIEKLRWFTRDEIKAQASTLLLPSRVSIARAMIELWLGESIETGTEVK